MVTLKELRDAYLAQPTNAKSAYELALVQAGDGDVVAATRTLQASVNQAIQKPDMDEDQEKVVGLYAGLKGSGAIEFQVIKGTIGKEKFHDVLSRFGNPQIGQQVAEKSGIRTTCPTTDIYIPTPVNKQSNRAASFDDKRRQFRATKLAR